jgi:predicted nucleotidyltransferase
MEKDIIKSFEPQDELNPKIWEKGSKEPEMKPEVRERLLNIAYEFIDFVGIDMVISDVVLTGSLANYTWSKYSDFDLHVIINFLQFPENQRELYKELFNLKKIMFNQKYNIKIFGYEVELYLEDEAESHFSSGVYTLLFDEWATEPKKQDVSIDKKTIESKAKQWMRIIDGVLDNIQDEDIETAKELIEKYKEKLRRFRTCGLEKGGDYSSENLVFKILRRNGYLEKLRNAKEKLIQKKLSIDERKKIQTA